MKSIRCSITSWNNSEVLYEGRATLLLFFALSPLAVNASFVEQPLSAVISVGENATFSCSAVGFPAPEIVWTRDGVEFLGSSERMIATMLIGPQTTQSSLTITNARVNLTGTYQCISVIAVEGPPPAVESDPAVITVQGTYAFLQRCLASTLNINACMSAPKLASSQSM